MGHEKRSMRKEHKTLDAMVRIYCQGMHGTGGSLCDECSSVVEYAKKKVDRCRWGLHKPACSQCSTHCFTSDMRLRIHDIMRYAGPRMSARHPLLTLFHVLNKIWVKAPSIPQGNKMMAKPELQVRLSQESK